MKKQKLFIDTGAWIALLNSNDQYHERAVSFYGDLLPAVQRISSGHVISETYTWLRYRTGFRSASRFLSIIRKAKAIESMSVILEDGELLESAEQILTGYPDQKLSYADALSMAIMRRERIVRVFGFDRHFSIMDYEVVPN